MAKRMIASLALVVLTLGIGSTAQAQPADYKTYFTFSGPITLPGVTLPAGKYIFRLADADTGRKVVSIQSEDGRRQLAMLHTIPNQAPKAPNDPEIRFMETSSNVPPPVKTWWYPGKSIGYEFIYPRAQAMQLAKVTTEPVLTTAQDTTQFENADLSRVSGQGVPAPVRVEETPAPAAVTGRAQQGEVFTENQPAQAPAAGATASSQDTRADERARTTARTELPQTASAIPGMMLFGALSLVAGLGLSRRRTRE
jgi:LPXTG-motif cell wall-anchored protein